MTRARHIDRRALFASGAAAALLAASGVSAQSSPTRGGRLRAALSGAQRTDRFDSRQSQGLFMQVAMVGTVFDTLTEVAADGTLRGELATGWQGSPDARNWFLELRTTAEFHNGKAFGPQDVLASFDLHRDGVLSDVAEVTQVGRHRVKVTLHEPDPDFAYRLSDPRLVMYPARQIEEAMAQGIGTGLYRVHKFQPARQLLAHRVEKHYKDGSAGWFDQVELVSLPSDAVRAEALREQFVDVADLTHTQDLGAVERVTTLPKGDFMTTAVDDCIALPSQIGRRWPLDNLRAAERWWMA